ncbi:MAG: FAD-dependent oxidoreductase [Rhodospirillales bacterium]|jgi:sarcosine oxidase subunit beta|nr:FAD-dependent oxidoreductase [Rhodospirillales bacterium]
MSQSYDAIVIGAGIIGGCTAFELAKKGLRTLNIDKMPAAGQGSTGNSCAIIRVHYSTFDGAAMASEGVHYWKDWENYLEVDDESGFAVYRNVGCIVTKNERNNFLKTVCRNLTELGIEWEDWDADKLCHEIPIYDPGRYSPVRLLSDPAFGQAAKENLAGAIFTPHSGYVSDPQLSAHNVQRATEARGGNFVFNAEVVEIRQAHGRVAGVTLKDGERIDAPVVVNVAGPHSFLINRMAGVEDGMKIKTRALRQEVAHVPAPAGFDFETNGCVTSDGDIGCYYRPEVGNHILVGSEDPDCDELEWADPDDFNRNFTDQWKTQVYRLAQRIPSLGIPNRAKGVVDLYDVSDDWIPIYDKSDLAGFYMAIGTSGNQYKNAPVAGAMMAELIDRSEHGHDHDADPLRFALRHSGQTIDVGFYSRRREINPESSFSVIG